MLAGALLAGVGVAGISAVTANARPAVTAAGPPVAAGHTLAAASPSVTAGSPVAAGVALPASPPVAAGRAGTAESVLTDAPGPAPAYPTAAPEAATGGAPALDRAARKVRPAPPARWVNPLPQGRVTSCFGPRWGRLHAGVDIAAAAGTPIHAVGAGVVVSAGAEAGYGNAVLVDHGNGFLTHYGHMSKVTATVGQHVKPGDQLGLEGSTGHSTGPHLHFEVHQGRYKNPIEPTAWMHAHGVDIAGCVPLTDK